MHVSGMWHSRKLLMAREIDREILIGDKTCISAHFREQGECQVESSLANK